MTEGLSVPGETPPGKSKKIRYGDGNPGPGRPKGALNKVRRELKVIIGEFIENNAEEAQTLFDRVKETHPERALKLLVDLLDFTLLRMTRSEVTATVRAALPEDERLRPKNAIEASQAYEQLMRGDILPEDIAATPDVIEQLQPSEPRPVVVVSAESIRAAMFPDRAAPTSVVRTHPTIAALTPPDDPLRELPAEPAEAAAPSHPEPPIDPEVMRVMRTFVYDSRDPDQVAAMRRRAEHLVEQRRASEARTEAEAGRGRGLQTSALAPEPTDPEAA